jgi:hypothetical protein
MATRIAAANAILDRGWGKPKEHVDVSVQGPTLEEIVLASFRRERQAPVIEGEIVSPSETEIEAKD